MYLILKIPCISIFFTFDLVYTDYFCFTAICLIFSFKLAPFRSSGCILNCIRQAISLKIFL